MIRLRLPMTFAVFIFFTGSWYILLRYSFTCTKRCVKRWHLRVTAHTTATHVRLRHARLNSENRLRRFERMVQVLHRGEDESHVREELLHPHRAALGRQPTRPPRTCCFIETLGDVGAPLRCLRFAARGKKRSGSVSKRRRGSSPFASASRRCIDVAASGFLAAPPRRFEKPSRPSAAPSSRASIALFFLVFYTRPA